MRSEQQQQQRSQKWNAALTQPQHCLLQARTRRPQMAAAASAAAAAASTPAPRAHSLASSSISSFFWQPVDGNAMLSFMVKPAEGGSTARASEPPHGALRRQAGPPGVRRLPRPCGPPAAPSRVRQLAAAAARCGPAQAAAQHEAMLRGPQGVHRAARRPSRPCTWPPAGQPRRSRPQPAVDPCMARHGPPPRSPLLPDATPSPVAAGEKGPGLAGTAAKCCWAHAAAGHGGRQGPHAAPAALARRTTGSGLPIGPPRACLRSAAKSPGRTARSDNPVA